MNVGGEGCYQIGILRRLLSRTRRNERMSVAAGGIGQQTRWRDDARQRGAGPSRSSFNERLGGRMWEGSGQWACVTMDEPLLVGMVSVWAEQAGLESRAMD